MEFTIRYINDLLAPFRQLRGNTGALYLADELSLDSNNVYKHFFTLDLSKDDVIDIPIYCRAIVESTMKSNVTYPFLPQTSKIIIPLYVNSEIQHRRTADSIIKYFFNSVSFEKRLVKVVTNKDEVYYGGPGLILDKNFNPILLCTVRAEKEVGIDNKTYYSYTKVVIKVSPSVFTCNTGLLEKNILKKVIPLYITNPVNYIRVSARFLNHIAEDAIASVEVEDISKYIEKPIGPKTANIQEELNDLAINILEEIKGLYNYV